MKKVAIISNVSGGRLERNRRRINEAVATFEGKEVILTLERNRKTRSGPQNSYYFGVVIPLLQDALKEKTGEIRDSKSIHYQILLPLLAPTREIINRETGEIAREHLTSGEMTTTEFAEYISEIQKWARAFLSLEIPDPGTQLNLG